MTPELFSAIVLFKNQPFPPGFVGGFLGIPGKNGEVAPGRMLELCHLL